jgi:cation transport ATPase
MHGSEDGGCGCAAFLLFALSTLAAGYGLLKSAIHALLRLRVTREVLIGIAATGAFLIGHPGKGERVSLPQAKIVKQQTDPSPIHHENTL